MSYTALDMMKAVNNERFGEGTGPMTPELPVFADQDGLKYNVIHFIRDCCEGLGFDEAKTEEEQKSGILLGTSLKPGQIPYDMQMDINRLCLEQELSKFIDSGSAEDAYTVYYCYLETFFGHYGKSKKMVELLSEFESNGSSLLMKHRDHYSHSVYVFCLGMALYHSNSLFRDTFNSYYGFMADQSAEAACFFLRYWGMTSLFHDIGYPFELPFEQILSYFEVDKKKRGEGVPYLAYRELGTLNKLSRAAKSRFLTLYGRVFDTIEDLLSYSITEKLGSVYGITEDRLTQLLYDKPTHPDEFGFYMDHAYFSAARLFQQMESTFTAEALQQIHVDVLTAIILHNSLFKFSVSFYGDRSRDNIPLKIGQHPLAYLLMLCDELQCWDRTAYGRNSRSELHPMGADFDFSDPSVTVTYLFDIEEKEKIDEFEKEYEDWKNGGKTAEKPELKAYSSIAGEDGKFLSDISRIVDTSQIPLTVKTSLAVYDRSGKNSFLSRSSFLHLYDFALSLNGRYSYEGREKEIPEQVLENDFESMSLEYQLSNINQAKSFGRYLDAIGCFYTDQNVDYDIITSFNAEQTAVFAPLEHKRWVIEHRSMGWTYGDLYEKADCGIPSRVLREQLRMHKLAMDGEITDEAVKAHYESLPESEQAKDYEPFNSMLKLIRKYDGLRIYKLDSGKTEKQ